MKNFNKDQYRLHVWMTYIAADLCDGAVTDLESEMKKIGDYRFEAKRTVKTIKKCASDIIADVDKRCDNDFACNFGDIADEIKEIVREYLLKKLKHEDNK